jgi:transposase
MDLASVYRAIIRKHFPGARIVADRFHVIRFINHHVLACWREIDPTGAKHRGLLLSDASPPPQSQARPEAQTRGLLRPVPCPARNLPFQKSGSAICC